MAEASNRSSSKPFVRRPRKSPTTKLIAAKPAFLQTALQGVELELLQKLCHDEYSGGGFVSAQLSEELAGHIWEIRELTEIKRDLIREVIAEKAKKDLGAKLVNDPELTAAYSADRKPSKSLSPVLEKIEMNVGAWAFPEIYKIKPYLDMLDSLVTSAERRRDALLRELDRRQMAKLLIEAQKRRQE